MLDSRGYWKTKGNSSKQLWNFAKLSINFPIASQSSTNCWAQRTRKRKRRKKQSLHTRSICNSLRMVVMRALFAQSSISSNARQQVNRLFRENPNVKITAARAYDFRVTRRHKKDKNKKHKDKEIVWHVCSVSPDLSCGLCASLRRIP